MKDVLAAHRALYEAVETGDADLMTSLWVDSPDATCVHPGAEPLRGTASVLRSWTAVMAGVGYIQFFLTDVEAVLLPDGNAAVVTCTENILSGDLAADDDFGNARAVCTSVLVRTPTGWRFWARHASPVLTPGGER